MKNLTTILFAILFASNIFAQAPQKMSYQAVIRNSSNMLVVNTNVGMRISILRDSANGTAVYVETQTKATNTNGLVSIEIGGGTIISGLFSSINWATGKYFVKTETDPAGGTNYTITGTQQLLSVPFALYAANAPTHYIGELFGGGIVVAVWKVSGVEHGLIASLTDLSIGTSWSNVTSTLIGATAQSAYDGQANTNAIIAQSGHTSSAAQLCLSYSAGGFNDWYLPAAWELNNFYNAAFIVNSILGSANGFTTNYYWSSTEMSANLAYSLQFSGGAYVGAQKSGSSASVSVRAVRKF